ncbi:hypothetical protein PoB_006111600 [Plakobranchus ocellatus]|uniref:Uncharacterized protein n=1 Tax=Plakobranchus ocellatus TaxID=259542 RepID=A0AAV4CRY3_9GAST|nr:hypothetical protein PoB_006111600 [Plakobranchus ocellatus]
MTKYPILKFHSVDHVGGDLLAMAHTGKQKHKYENQNKADRPHNHVFEDNNYEKTKWGGKRNACKRLNELDHPSWTRIGIHQRCGANFNFQTQTVRIEKDGGENLDSVTNREPI